MEGQSMEEELDFMMVCPLQDSLTQENGPWIFKDPEGYEIDATDAEEFDKQFHRK